MSVQQAQLTQYVAFEIIEEKHAVKDHAAYTDSHEFQWLHKLLIYYHPPKLFVIIIILLIYFYYFFQLCVDEQHNNYHKDDLSKVISWVLTWIFTMVSRLFAVYYFYSDFQQQTKHYIQQPEKQNNALKKYCICIKFTLILYMCIDVASQIARIKSVLYEHETMIYKVIDIINLYLFRFFVLYPQWILVTLQSSIALKYYLHLSQISDAINTTQHIDTQYIFEQYNKLYKEFKKEQPISLQAAVQLFLVAEMFFMWDKVLEDEFFSGDWGNAFDISTVIITFCLYILPASLITESHREFVNVLWSKNEHILLRNNDTFDIKLYYNHLLHFIERYPIQIAIGNVGVTKRNTIKFIIIFLVTKLGAFALRLFIQDKYPH